MCYVTVIVANMLKCITKQTTKTTVLRHWVGMQFSHSTRPYLCQLSYWAAMA